MAAGWLVSATLALSAFAQAGGADMAARGASATDDLIVTATSEGAARWDRPICIGVTGLRPDVAQSIVDRVSQRAYSVGLTPGEAGCTSNVLVIFSNDADGQARSISGESTDPASGLGRSGTTLGRAAFADFLTTDRPVRWWQVSRTVTDAGEVVDRNERAGEPQRVLVPETGRLRRATHLEFSHAIVIVDMTQVAGVRFDALADYIAMAALSGIDGRSNLSGRSTVMNLFGPATNRPTGLTDWDMAYLRALYTSGSR